MSGPRRSTRQPPPSESTPAADINVEPAVRELLKLRSLGNMPLRFVVLVEGTTDIDYLNAALQIVQAQCSCDLLDLGDNSQIALRTPLKPGGFRGGIPELERLASDLMPFVIRLEAVGPICFVLDHDFEGKRAAKAIRESGYRVPRAMAITLDPKEHPLACCPLKGEPVVCVEDLLSPRVQTEFFEQETASCEVSFDRGVPVKYVWHGESKSQLPSFVAANGRPHDVIELVRLIVRIRRMWNLDVPAEVEQLLQSRDAAAT